MVEINIPLLIGVFLSFAAPLGYSIWVETRFVQQNAATLYGFASISFGILYYYSVAGSDVGLWAIGLFIPLGILFVILSRVLDVWDDEKGIIFSYKTIGGFQLAFLYIAFLSDIFGDLPQMIEIPFLNIVAWGGLLSIILHSTIAPIRYIKN